MPSTFTPLGSFEYHQYKILLESDKKDGQVEIRLIEWTNKFDDITKSIYPYSVLGSAVQVFEHKVTNCILQTKLPEVSAYQDQG